MNLEAALAPYDFDLPSDRIAQVPTSVRDAARLFVLDRSAPEGQYAHAHVRDLPGWLRPDDLLVLNTTRVQPARLLGRRESGGAAEALILGPAPAEPGEAGPCFRALIKISGRVRAGIDFTFGPKEAALKAEIAALLDAGEVLLRFEEGASPYSVGEPPLPPYIRRDAAARTEYGEIDRERYQTVFARVPGAIAAPTAGLHFTDALLDELGQAGIARSEVVLHVGPGTFRPLSADAMASGRLHSEAFELPERTAEAIAQTRERGGRVVAVGTTSARVLEANARGNQVQAGSGETDLFLQPGSKFQVVDVLLTNFHLPRSSLLLLVSAFAGRERVLAAYREAVAQSYRFFSYGDAMLIL